MSRERAINNFFKESEKLREKYPELDITMIIRAPDLVMPKVHKDNEKINPIQVKKKRSLEAAQCSILSFVERKKAKTDSGNDNAANEDNMQEQEDLSVLDFPNPFESQTQSQQQSQGGEDPLDFKNPFEDSQSQQSQDLFATDECDFE